MAWLFFHSASIPKELADLLYAVSPVHADAIVTDLPGVSVKLTANKEYAACAKGFSRKLVPIGAQEYNTALMRKTFDIFGSLPAALRNSVMFAKGYTTNCVKEIEPDSIAYLDRTGEL